jgi:hypothetical protein
MEMIEMTDLFNEMSCALTGSDCEAAAAFIRVSLSNDVTVQAVAAHWKNASEELREALAPHLGLTEPTEERVPINQGIMKAYFAAFERAAELVGEPSF